MSLTSLVPEALLVDLAGNLIAFQTRDGLVKLPVTDAENGRRQDALVACLTRLVDVQEALTSRLERGIVRIVGDDDRTRLRVQPGGNVTTVQRLAAPQLGTSIMLSFSQTLSNAFPTNGIMWALQNLSAAQVYLVTRLVVNGVVTVTASATATLSLILQKLTGITAAITGGSTTSANYSNLKDSLAPSGLYQLTSNSGDLTIASGATGLTAGTYQTAIISSFAFPLTTAPQLAIVPFTLWYDAAGDKGPLVLRPNQGLACLAGQGPYPATVSIFWTFGVEWVEVPSWP